MKNIELFTEGDRVVPVGIDRDHEDWDAGRVLEILPHTILVGWDSGVRTEVAESDITAE